MIGPRAQKRLAILTAVIGVGLFLGANYDDTIFDDEAPTAITQGLPPFRGSFRPSSPLSVLDGTSALGTWTLEVSDNWFLAGTLNAWSLAMLNPCLSTS